MSSFLALERRERARSLRKAQTSAEAALWAVLRNRRLAGLKFRRQVTLDRYVLDFYCHEHQLVVELDGEVHEEPRQREHDTSRDSYLTSRGLRVLRFANREVFENLDGVLRCVLEAVGPHPRPLSQPPSRTSGRGESSS